MGTVLSMYIAPRQPGPMIDLPNIGNVALAAASIHADAQHDDITTLCSRGYDIVYQSTTGITAVESIIKHLVDRASWLYFESQASRTVSQHANLVLQA